jgi:hypothetical protein
LEKFQATAFSGCLRWAAGIGLVGRLSSERREHPLNIHPRAGMTLETAHGRIYFSFSW